jgi:glutamate synthase domain-containing protein 2
MPIVIPGLGSTAIAKNNWEGLAIGAAISGIMLTIGENVCGMDPKSEIVKGKVKHSPELEWRENLYKKWQRDGYGAIVVQSNVEDTKLGVHEYAISELDVDAVELKWGQGAERHSRVGMVTEESFLKRVKELRDLGAKHVFLKTGAYRPVALAQALKYASKAKIDLLTVDAAGGGTGMSPWRMMNEWGVPEVELHSLLYKYADKLTKKGKYVPDIAIAGGFSFEDQMLKGLALGAPYFKLIGMARAPLAAAMVGKTIGKKIDENMVPVYIERFGDTKEEIFVTAPDLKRKFGKDFEKVPTGAMGVYTYMERLHQGLRQIMAGCRKFSLEHISRDDIAALTKESADISSIPYITDVDDKEVNKILNG